MLAAGEPGTGTMWTAPYGSPLELLTNAHGLAAINERLGAPPFDESITCQTVKDAKDEERCGIRLRPEDHHPHECKAGNVRLRPHTAVAATLARLMREAGAYTDLERHIPHLYDSKTHRG